MNVNDSEILDRIERLARDAGRADALNEQAAAPADPPAAVTPHAVKLMVRYWQEMSDPNHMPNHETYYTFTDGVKVTCGEMRTALAWFAEKAGCA